MLFFRKKFFSWHLQQENVPNMPHLMEKLKYRISSYPLSFILTPYMTFSHTHTSAYLSTWENVCFPSFSLKQTDSRHCLRLQASLQCKLMDIQNHTWNRKLINSVTEFPLHIGNCRLPHRRTPHTSTHLRMTSKINNKANFAERHNIWNRFDAILLIVCYVKGASQWCTEPLSEAVIAVLYHEKNTAADQSESRNGTNRFIKYLILVWVGVIGHSFFVLQKEKNLTPGICIKK